MGRRGRVPPELTRGPFAVERALSAGLSRKQLLSGQWRRLAWGRYVWAGHEDHPLYRLHALATRLPLGAAFSGRTAGWLYGLDLEPCQPVDVTAPLGGGVSARAGVRLRRCVLSTTEVTRCRGLPVTSPVRTAFDLARHLSLAEAVMAVDMALHAALVRPEELQAHVDAHPTARGRVQARQVLGLAEPRSESPMETRLRLALVQAGLPRPQAQVELADQHGRFIARVDLYYPDQRLAIEYDGDTHRDSLAADDRRQNRLLAAGYHLLRFTAADLPRAPAVVAGYVR